MMNGDSAHYSKLSGRKRIPLSCNQCKRRKVKCDRKVPCSSCVKHKVGDACEYLEDQVMTHETTGTLMVFKHTQASDNLEVKVSSKRKKCSKQTVFHVDGPITQATAQVQASTQAAAEQPAPLVPPPVSQMQYAIPPNSGFQTMPHIYGDSAGSLEPGAHHNSGNNRRDSQIYTDFGAPFLAIPNGRPFTPAGIPGVPGIPRSPDDEVPDNSELNEPFDVYTGYTSVFRDGGKNVNHGPFSWYSYIQKDKALRALWDVTNQQNKKDAFSKKPEAQESEFIRSSERDSVNSARRLDQVSPNTRKNLKANLNKKTLALGLTVFEGTMDHSLDIIEKLKLILPNKRAVFLLIKRFFQVVYPYMCVIDETYFRGEIHAILGPECKSEEMFDHINIRKRKDFATMGILLIVLRISYLSTFSNIARENEDIVNSPYSLSDDLGDESSPATGESYGSEYQTNRQRILLFESKYILTHPISIDFMEYVQACLDQVTGPHKCSLSVLQCLIMKRLYSDIAPEETDSADGYDSSTLNATCIQIGYCIGIHRDEDSVSGQYSSVQDIRYANICRKIWFYVKLMDLKLAWQFGFPIMVDHNYSNVKGPYFTRGASNVLNDELESKLCSLLAWTGSFYRNFGEMIRRCLMLQYPLKVSELLSLMDMFEEKVSEDLGTLSDYTTSAFTNSQLTPGHMRRRSRKTSSKSSYTNGSPGMKIELGGAEMSKEKVIESSEYPFVKVLKLKVLMNMKQFSMSIFYHLYLNFEKSGRYDLSFSYAYKIVSFFCGEFIPEILNLLLSTRSNFDSSSTTPGLILNHSIIALIHKCNQIFLSIISRTRYKILKMKSAGDHKTLIQTSEPYRHRFGSICSLTNILSDIVRFNISCLSRLNHRYYYAWRICRTHTYVLNKTMSDEFNQKLTELDYPFIELSQAQIDELLSLSHGCFTKIEHLLKQPNTDGVNGNEAKAFQEAHFHSSTQMSPSDMPGVAPNTGGPTVKHDPSVPFSQSFQSFSENHDFEEHNPLMGFENFAWEQIPETDLLWQQISNMKEDNKREFTKDAPNDISDKFFPLSPQQSVFPPFDMNGAFEGFSNMYV